MDVIKDFSNLEKLNVFLGVRYSMELNQIVKLKNDPWEIMIMET